MIAPTTEAGRPPGIRAPACGRPIAARSVESSLSVQETRMTLDNPRPSNHRMYAGGGLCQQLNALSAPVEPATERFHVRIGSNNVERSTKITQFCEVYELGNHRIDTRQASPWDDRRRRGGDRQRCRCLRSHGRQRWRGSDCRDFRVNRVSLDGGDRRTGVQPTERARWPSALRLQDRNLQTLRAWTS